MKGFVFAIITLVVCICSCSQPKDKNKVNIENAFKEYASQNFDGPTSLKEIVDITYTDSMSRNVCAVMVKLVSQMNDSLHNLGISNRVNVICHKNIQRFRELMRYNPQFRYDWNSYRESCEEQVKLSGEWLNEQLSNGDNYTNWKEIIKMKDFHLLDFTIKYRIKEKGELLLKQTDGHYDVVSGKVYWGDLDMEHTHGDEFLNNFKKISNTLRHYNEAIRAKEDLIEKGETIISYFE